VTPLARNTLIKTKYPHREENVNSKRSEVQTVYEMETQRNGIIQEAISKPEVTEGIQRQIAQQRELVDGSQPYMKKMRSYLEQQLDQMAKEKFQLQPMKPVAQVQLHATIPLPGESIEMISFND
jgi:hypothetical protein